MGINVTTESAQLALDTILQKPTKGIPNWMIHIMEHSFIERIAGAKLGDYKKCPEKTYLAFQHAVGACLLDQYIPFNPLDMGDYGYENTEKGPTTGAEEIIVDGMVIDSPEVVAEHMERFEFSKLYKAIDKFNENHRVKEIIENEKDIQNKLGPTILKSGYGFISFPKLIYGKYSYKNYFMAYALYPEVIEKHFSLQADLALLNNQAAARTYVEGNLPPLYRLDHDMADFRGTLVDIKSLDKIWFPHFARSLEPLLKTDVRMIWHCDGNLMEMLPRLLEVGIRGFQGFQYEARMDYEKICAMKTRDGKDLIIIAGVSVTRTLPKGTPAEVKKEMTWLVEKGPKTGLFLACSSTITPGVPWENIQALIEGFKYYRAYGRSL